MSPGFCWIMTRIQPCLPPASHRALFFADKIFPKLSIFFHLFSPSRNNHDLLWVQYCGWDWRHSAHNMCSLPLWTWVWPFHTRYPGQLGSPELCIWWGNLWVVSGKISRNRRIIILHLWGELSAYTQDYDGGRIWPPGKSDYIFNPDG